MIWPRGGRPQSGTPSTARAGTSRRSGWLGSTLLAVAVLALLSGLGPQQMPSQVSLVRTTSPVYVALGDSYSSGQGAPPFRPVSKADGCDRSNLAYGPLIYQRLLRLYPDQHWRFRFVACSGAVTDNLTAGGQNGEPPEGTDLSPSARLVTVTIGGNDIGFAPILADCELLSCNLGALVNPYIAHLSENLAKLVNTLVATYRYIEQRAPLARLIVLQYPDLVPPYPSPSGCSRAFPLFPENAAFLAPYERQLNADIAEAAKRAGAMVVNPNEPGQSYSFLSHSACSQSAWLHGLVVNPADYHDLAYSFHPKPVGQAAMAAAIVDQGGLSGL
jgi:lysophospholipase L1-like esterase